MHEQMYVNTVSLPRRTTVDIPADLYRALKVSSALQFKTIKEMVLASLVGEVDQLSEQRAIERQQFAGEVPVKRLTFEVPGDLHRRMRVLAAEQDRDIKDIVVGALKNFVESNFVGSKEILAAFEADAARPATAR